MKYNWKYRLLALLLAACTVFGLGISAQASSLADGSKTCTISQETRHTYLMAESGTYLGGAGYTYTTNDGLTGAAYCIDHGLHNTTKVLPITGKYNASPAAAGAFANGYPQHSLETFLDLYLDRWPILAGLTVDEYRYATQIAVWASLGQLGVEGTAFTQGREFIPTPTGDLQQMRVFRAVQCILSVAKDWTMVYQAGMNIRVSENELDGNTAIPPTISLEAAADRNVGGIRMEVINGKTYYTKEYTFSSATSTYYQGYTIDVWATGCPAGTIFVDLSNQELPSSKWHDTKSWRLPVDRHDTTLNINGFEYRGKAKLCIPVETATPSGEITVHCGAQIMQYEIYLAENDTAREQSYILADPSKGVMESDAVLSWGGPETETGKLQIRKVGGGGSPLAGAEFVLTGTDGTRRTGTTDGRGIILWEMLDPLITYTLTETEAPAGYSIVAPMTVTVKAGHIEYVTVRDDPQHTLTVHKIDRQSGYSLRGAVIKFEQINGSFSTTAITDHAGNIQFNADRLPLGSYKVYEVRAPEGYELDGAVQTVHWDGKRDMTLTFANVRKPTLIISKQDSRTHYGLPDATFEVYRNGQLVTTVTTNDTGLAYVSGTSGYYEIKEIAAPRGYALNNKIYGINIDPYDPATTNDPRLVLENDPLPGLRIVKYDQQSKTPLANTSFKVYRDTVPVGTYTTDQYGEILLTGLEPGTYTVEEVAAPDSHTVNSTPQSIELMAGQKEDATLVFFNVLKPGIHLTKVDSKTLAPLPNATYLISKVGGSFSKEYVTDVNGEIDLSKLEPGAYIVKEVKAPEGYLMDDGIRTIQLNAGMNAQFVFTDTPKPSLSVVKYDPNTGKYLPGAIFRISKIEDGSHYLDRVTDTQGRITISNMEPGIYSVQEMAAPAGYVLNSTEYHVELFPGKDSELVVPNEAKPDLRIIKTDAITGDPVAGVTFTVKMADGYTLTTEATNEQGEVFLGDMEPGVVEIWEQSVPNNYLLNEEHQFITLVTNKTGTVHFQNYPKPSLTIHKVDFITGDPIQGAKFHIVFASGNTFSGELNDLGTYTSTNEGKIVLTGLKDGWYRVQEVEPAAGYSIKEPVSQDIYIKAGESKELTFENTPLNALIIKKVDGVTSHVLQGAKFRLRYFEGVSGTGGTVIGEYETSAQGTIVITNLKAGTYIAEEVRAPEGYVLDDAPQTVYISGKEQAVVTLEFANQPNSGLTITKLDSRTNKPLAEAVFEIRNSSGAVVGTSTGRYTTDKTGVIHLANLPADTYVVKEVQAPSGYKLDGTPQTVRLTHGETHSLTFYNSPTPVGELRIVKLDEETRQPIAGVEFLVTRINGQRVGTYRTNSRGIISLDGLTPGWYTVTETKAAEGYRLDAQPHDIQVKDSRTSTLELTNRQSGSALIHKIDAVTGKGIYGVTFLVSDNRGKPVGIYTSDQNGYVYIDGELADGKYTIREIQQAEGYILDAAPKTVYIEYGGCSTVVWKNTPIRGQIQVVKRSADYNPTNGLPAGTILEGAVFEVYDERTGNKVDTIVSGANGLAVSQQLPLGRYIVREVKAPAYYLVNDTPMTAVLEYSGQIIRFEVTDKSAVPGVAITKTGPKEIVSSQPVRYVFDRIANTGNVTLDSFYWRDNLPTAVTLNKVVTGSYNRPGTYKVVYKVNNTGDYRTLADNLSTARSYTLDARPDTLGLAANERITEVMLVFGQAPAGFAQVEAPMLYCTAVNGLEAGSSITNTADVGGVYNGAWVQAVTRWTTSVYGKPMILPRTGY